MASQRASSAQSPRHDIVRFDFDRGACVACSPSARSTPSELNARKCSVQHTQAADWKAIPDSGSIKQRINARLGCTLHRLACNLWCMPEPALASTHTFVACTARQFFLHQIRSSARPLRVDENERSPCVWLGSRVHTDPCVHEPKKPSTLSMLYRERHTHTHCVCARGVCAAAAAARSLDTGSTC